MLILESITGYLVAPEIHHKFAFTTVVFTTVQQLSSNFFLLSKLYSIFYKYFRTDERIFNCTYKTQLKKIIRLRTTWIIVYYFVRDKIGRGQCEFMYTISFLTKLVEDNLNYRKLFCSLPKCTIPLLFLFVPSPPVSLWHNVPAVCQALDLYLLEMVLA